MTSLSQTSLSSPTHVLQPQEARSWSESEDQLDAVRGILIGALISSAVWGAVIASLIYWID